MIIASLIIPVYNAQGCIAACLDSALAQTFIDYEIIAINDGSKDESEAILAEYATRYSDKLRIFNQANLGVAVTRNRGIGYARGKYVLFMDNDDTISRDYIEQFVIAADQNEADMVIGWHYQVEKGKPRLRRLTNNKWSAFRFLTPWARIYRKSFLTENGIEFLDTKMGEEIYCSVRAALSTDKIIILPYSGYYWNYNDFSVSHTLQKGFQNAASPLKMLKSLYEDTDMKLLSAEKKNMFEYFYIKYCMWYLLDSGRHVGPRYMESEYRQIIGVLYEFFPEWRKNPLISLSQPIGETIFTRSIVFWFTLLEKPGVTKFLYKLYSL
jgi:glycosyltransferase involved in cell wall biosynthesis